MKIITDETQYSGAGAVLALGMFDGVHLGHRRLIDTAAALAKDKNADLMVCTFDRHPLSVLSPGNEPMQLTDLDERLRVFEDMGADYALVMPFTRKLAAMDAKDFLRNLAVNTRARAIVCGENYTFGRFGAGNIETIKEMCDLLGYEPVTVKSVMDAGEVISATHIRALIKAGETEKAKLLMGKK